MLHRGIDFQTLKDCVASDPSILDRWNMSPDFLTRLVDNNPSLRGMLFGYVAEGKLREVFDGEARVSNIRKDDDHDRKKKGDMVVSYRGREFKFEAKALQTNSIEMRHETTEDRWVKKVVRDNGKYVHNAAYIEKWKVCGDAAEYRAKVQCDASDSRDVVLADGSTLKTTCLLVGEFDILAAGLFSFRNRWEFAYALNSELPRTDFKNYTAEQKRQLLATMIPVSLPLQPPFVADPFVLMERLLEEARPR